MSDFEIMSALAEIFSIYSLYKYKVLVAKSRVYLE